MKLITKIIAIVSICCALFGLCSCDISKEILESAYESGYDSGYKDGHKDGRDADYNDGYDDGYNVGHSDGYDVGYDDGYSAGCDDGYDSGYDAGYDVGYVAGNGAGFYEGYVSRGKTDNPHKSVNYTSSTSSSTSSSNGEPANGEILSGSTSKESSLTVTASNSSYVVKLKTISGNTVVSFYVKAGQTATIGVPKQLLFVYFACGETWYSKDELFGPDTYYAMDEDILNFMSYTWEYTLYPSPNGNFEVTPIDASEF